MTAKSASARDAGSASETESERRSAAARRALGPRPLFAHLAALLSDLQAGVAAAARFDDPRFPWEPEARDAADALGARLRALEVQDAGARGVFARAVAATALDDVAAALEGVEAYHVAKPVRRPAEPRTIWRSGSARLLDFAAKRPGEDTAGAAPDPRPAVVALPSLINGPEILDLTRARSLLRGLDRRGVRPFLLDWGEPRGEERGFGAADYALRRGAPAIRAAAERAGGPVAVLGHCMGGVVAASAVYADPEPVRRLALLAAPWDFREARDASAAQTARGVVETALEVCGEVFGGLPPDILNLLFFLHDPLQAARKFPRARRVPKRGPAERLFVAVEDWLNEGRLLAAPAARDLLIDWGLDNALARGVWPVGAHGPLRLDAIDRPLMIVASRADTLTPFASARAAFAASQGARLLRPSGGHIGMIVGREAEAELWDPLARWLVED